MTVLVTGSSGFLATYFRSSGCLPNERIIYATTRSGTGQFLQFRRSYADIEEVLDDIEISAIIHMAAEIPTTFAETTFEGTFDPNVRMMNNLYNFAIARKVSKFVYISTFGSMSDSTRLDIKDFYTASKIVGEHFCAMLSAQGTEAAALRISSPYGEHANKNTVLNMFVKRALSNEDINIYGTGSRSQNFVYAADVMQAIEKCFEEPINGTYSIVSKHNTSMLELAQTVVDVTGSNSRILVGEKPDPQEGFSFPHSIDARTKDELGYKPQYSLRDGLTRYVSWLLLQQHAKAASI